MKKIMSKKKKVLKFMPLFFAIPSGPQISNGYTNGGFTPASLSVPTSTALPQLQQQQQQPGMMTGILPQTQQNTAEQINLQPIRTIQPVSRGAIHQFFNNYS
jgi:hypothetical protein